MSSESKPPKSREWNRGNFHTKALPHLTETQQQAYSALRANLLEAIQPGNPLEQEVFEKLIHACWQLDRIQSLEDAALFGLIQDPDQENHQKTYNDFQRFRRALDRTIVHCFSELRRLDSSRVSALLDFRQSPDSQVSPTLRNILFLSLTRLKGPLFRYSIQRMRSKSSSA